jgi:hypothetical protein
MTRFLEVTGNSGAKAAVNVDHIVDFWPMSDAFRAYLGGVASNCHAGLSTSRCGESDEGVWHVRETYDEIKALLLAGGAVITEGEGT